MYVDATHVSVPVSRRDRSSSPTVIRAVPMIGNGR